MGWWDYDLLSGDPPMDTLVFLADHIGTEDLYPLDFTDAEAVILRAKLEQAESSILEHDDLRGDDALPVVAAVFLATGAAMSDKFRSEALRATRNDYYADNGWIDGGVGRTTTMTNLATLIEAHEPGRRVVIEHKGLFETLESK